MARQAFVYRCPHCKKLTKSRSKLVSGKRPNLPRPCGCPGTFWYVLFYEPRERIAFDLTKEVA